MKIIMLSDLDTGGLAAILKPAFQKLGHDVTVMQTVKTYLDGEGEHIDFLMGQMPNEDFPLLEDEFKEADLFIIRTVTDFTLKATKVLGYLNKHNTIYRIHGSELRENRVPYTMRTWMINWFGNEPVVVGPRDPSLFKYYEGNVITHIERPMNIELLKTIEVRERGIHAVTTPTNMYRKGADLLIEKWKNKKVSLQVLSGVSREEALEAKAGASYYVDRVGEYEHGPYGVNSIEAWFLRVPVFSQYSDMDVVVCPELPKLVNYVNIDNIEKVINKYKRDDIALDFAYEYAMNTHHPLIIAQQYIALAKAIQEKDNV